jgi:hypothetical protein
VYIKAKIAWGTDLSVYNPLSSQEYSLLRDPTASSWGVNENLWWRENNCINLYPKIRVKIVDNHPIKVCWDWR